VPLTSYRFLQTPPHDDALAIRIVFPLAGATLASFSKPGLPASLGKQKTGGPLQAARHGWRFAPLYFFFINSMVTFFIFCSSTGLSAAPV